MGIIESILADTAWTLAFIGVLLALVAALVLIAAPARALAFGDKLNREFSVGWVQRVLDEPRRAEPFIYRHHRIVGFLFIVATVYFFWIFATSYRVDALAAIYDGLLPAPVLDILADTLTAVLVIGNAAGFAVGVVMLLRPSALKKAEAAANRWIDTDRAAATLDRRVDRPEGYAHAYPRRLGVMILLAALYVATIGVVLLR